MFKKNRNFYRKNGMNLSDTACYFLVKMIQDILLAGDEIEG